MSLVPQHARLMRPKMCRILPRHLLHNIWLQKVWSVFAEQLVEKATLHSFGWDKKYKKFDRSKSMSYRKH